MKKTVFPILLLSALALAAGKKKTAHREHEAHVHGGATLAIAFDGFKGRLEFRAASEGVLGFEHEAKTDKDKKTLADVQAKFEKASDLFQFDASLGCQISKDKITVHRQGKHSDFVADYQVTCTKSPTKTKMQIDLSSFPGLQDVDITVLTDSSQQNIEAKQMPVTIEF
jgi:hypothetical protein